MLLVGLFAPGEQCSAAATIGMLYYFILAHQFIAAELNVAAGASIPEDVENAWLAAKAYFEGKTTPERNELIKWAGLLDDYNNGKVGPGHCD